MQFQVAFFVFLVLFEHLSLLLGLFLLEAYITMPCKQSRLCMVETGYLPTAHVGLFAHVRHFSIVVLVAYDFLYVTLHMI